MNRVNLTALLQKLVSGKIDPKTYSELKATLKEASDDELDRSLKALWDRTTCVHPMNEDLKAEVLSNIHRTVHIPSAPLRRSVWWKYAAAIMLPLMIAVASYFVFYIPPQDCIILSEKGQKSQVFLPDGTHVWLNSGSKLIYSTDFSKRKRRVRIEGEAFFDVTEDKQNKFIVETGLANIIVHGTAFNVSAYREDENIEISLLNGKVSIENPVDKQIVAVMRPNQQVTIDKKDFSLLVTDCDARLISLWTQNMLKFENAPVNEVIKKLEQWYGLDIHVENFNPETRYGFTLKSESIREMLDLINKITPLTYQVNGKEVYIKYK